MKQTCCVYWLFDAGCSTPERDGYIGITDDLPRRLKAHYQSKRFPSSFKVKVLFSGDRNECVALEFNLRPENGIGWNIAQGGLQTKGHLGKKHSNEAKEKMRVKKLGKKHTLESRAKMGRPMSEENKAKLIAKNTGSKRTDEQRAKMSVAQVGNKKTKGIKQSPEWIEQRAAKHRGLKHSEEAKEKMRLANLGKRYALGIKHTDEARANMSAAHKGKVMPIEQRVKISAALKGKKKPKDFGAKISELKRGNTYGLGTTRSEETRRRMSDAQRKRFSSCS